MHKQSFLPNLPRSRALKSSITEVLNFIRDNIEDLLTKRAIVYTIGDSAIGRGFSSSLMVMDDDEIKRLQDREEEGKRSFFSFSSLSFFFNHSLLSLVRRYHFV